jgi:hypothetical protein
MSRRLFYLNAALLLAIIGACFLLRDRWQSARIREDMMRSGRLIPLRWTPKPPIPGAKSVSALEYTLVSSQMLFSRDRNPNVPIEIPPPKPEPKWPPLPKAYGLMLLGEKPRILLGNGPNNQKSYVAGEKVGEIEIVSFDNQNIIFGWNDKTIEKRIVDLVDNNPMGSTQNPANPAAAAGVAAAPVKPANSGGGLTAIGGAAADAAKIGADTGLSGTKSCTPGDNSPAGTVLNGMKKVVVQGMFGGSCYWEPVK